jgi:hypothetical protein
MNENARALPVGAACYLCTQDPQLNSTNEKYRFLPLSFRRLYRAADLDLRLTRVAILS